MSPRARAGKSSSSNLSPTSIPIRKLTRYQKKNSLEQISSTLNQPKQKRLSNLTATTLLQYCSSILSPSRKVKTKTFVQTSHIPEIKTENHIPVRLRREASSRASAMIMQQNEIERSRINYSNVTNANLKRHRSKNTVSPSPPLPSINTDQSVDNNIITENSVIPKYALLTEANLAEHTRLQEKINNKHGCLVKWTEDLATYGRFSPPYPQEEIPITKEINPPTIFNHLPPPPTFLFPSSSPLDLRSFYPLLPYWEYPNWSFQFPKTFHLHTHHHVHNITKKTTRRKFSPNKRRTSSLPIKSTLSKRRSISATLTSSSPKKKSHHWILVGPFERKLVLIHPDKPPVFRQCYTSIQHITEKDIIHSHDCVILRSEKKTQPFLAKVKYFWQETDANDIQMSILWYYHPEHTELPVHIKEEFLSNELLASKYADCISVACIEDKCYVLNLNEYNRLCFREKSIDLFEQSASIDQLKSLLNKPTNQQQRSLPSKNVANQNIFFCRYVYDYRVKRILKNPSFVNTN